MAVDAYYFSGIRTLVDVGGGHGILIATVLVANPSLQGVLFEQPNAEAPPGAPQRWPASAAAGELPRREVAGTVVRLA